MRADVLVGPTSWVSERFGARSAGELWTRIPEALRTAIARAVHSRPHEPQTVDRLLDNPRWPHPYEELAVYLGELPGAEVVTAKRSAYQLVVVNGHIVLPWRYGPSGAVSMRDVPPGRGFGRLARELIARYAPPQPLPGPQLPLVRDIMDEREVAALCAELAKVHPKPQLVLAGYAGSADHGLLRACLGVPGTTASGTLAWRHADDLPLPAPAIPRPRRMQFP
ncbi:hypothetical protein [Spirilliplanes yamanashiensis]|uniref:Uncharacterized protein n=1 Tax=Spirilliplanes yamanashiensis TaxID=42233 RepID=A0A8J3YBN0_9ACTN|nr:hypothetical protein [Spirilliplanes yamanashiensis]MDP9816211.1 hypothetical protein [Spirilliplanes yamanashiensis]GIJ05736.1 hypothetical protein Sya03_50880 [Spirilliplanes yamanashiensis]